MGSGELCKLLVRHYTRGLLSLNQIQRQSQGSQVKEFPHFAKDMFHKLQISLNIFEFSSGSLLSLRSQAHAVTQSGFAGGEFLPLPRSEGAGFPCLLILEGSPPLPQRRSETAGSHKNGETPQSGDVAQGQEDPSKWYDSADGVGPCITCVKCGKIRFTVGL